MALTFHPKATKAVLNHYDEEWCVIFDGPEQTEIEMISRNDIGDVIFDANLSDEGKVVSCVEQFLRNAGHEVRRDGGTVVRPFEIASWSLSPPASS